MATRCVPVTTGAPQFVTREVGPFRVTDARFPPRLTLPAHVHRRPVIAVILDGSFDDCFKGKTFACTPGTLLTEPAEERHANRFEDAGSRVLVIEPDPAAADLLAPCRRLLDGAGTSMQPWLVRLARDIAGELASWDDLAPLAIEGLALELLVSGTRRKFVNESRGRTPAWLRQAEELIRAEFRTPLRVARVADQVGVHPERLGRVFRKTFRHSVAGYIRRLRAEWAAERLVSTDETLSRIALQAGFADQSHFTRVFREYWGVTPRRFRKQH